VKLRQPQAKAEWTRPAFPAKADKYSIGFKMQVILAVLDTE